MEVHYADSRVGAAHCRIPKEKVLDGAGRVWAELKEVFESNPVVCLKGLDLSPSELEAVLDCLGRRVVGKPPLAYERWPGQSPGVEGCPHLALLGNYRARRDNDWGVKCSEGDQIAEYKPATMDASEFHTDGSFLALPKAGVALYAPMINPRALPPEGGETRFASCDVDGLPRVLVERLRGLSAVHS
ncbi:hypothetical protein CTAYLR_008676 [Chrysophaeum taylorii]|uniref:TauD/TfdA-like domain-containing protein n=1 Tax=Chrysophaeum taylorii TaxID=2483200 RepID=A0AAD7UNV0_9STRA|nr:hypothetical protein CTAYLR_008676 [Chrysophaeum taylorii]